MSDPTNALFSGALRELEAVLSRVDANAIERACLALANARRIGTYGCGREALQIKGFAMRLFHFGLPVSVVGDMTMPSLGESDVFFASSGPGETTTVLTLMKVARDAGAWNLLVTAQPKSSAAAMADDTILIPAQTMASDQGSKRTSVLPMGSVFEGALFLLFEIMILRLKDILGATPEAMRARHTNME